MIIIFSIKEDKSLTGSWREETLCKSADKLRVVWMQPGIYKHVV